MDTRQLIELQRSQNRNAYQSLGRSTQPQVIRIGDHDSKTGLYEVVREDGSRTFQGVKIYNAESGGDAIAYPMPSSNGTIGLDGVKAKAQITGGEEEELILPLEDNCQGYLNGQIFNCGFPQRKKEKLTPGFVFWLDVNWLVGEYPGATKNVGFLSAIVNYFLRDKSTKVLWTIDTTQDTRFRVVTDSYDISLLWVFNQVIKDEKIIVKKVGTDKLGAIKGFCYFPLMSPDAILTKKEVDILKKIAESHGLIFQGEWRAWEEFNNRILTAFGVGDRIKVKIGSAELRADWLPSDNPIIKGKGIERIYTGATGVFEGVNPEEVLATSILSGKPTAIFLQVK